MNRHSAYYYKSKYRRQIDGLGDYVMPALIGFCVFLVLFVAFVPIKTENSYVTGLTWQTARYLKEDYTTIECTTSTVNGKTSVTCAPETHTRTLREAYLSGTYKEEIEYPPMFEEWDSDQYNEKTLSYTVHYKNGRTRGVGPAWMGHWVGQECKLYVSLAGIVMWDKCGESVGR